MGLGDLLRPRWRHTDPAVRRVAVERADLERLRAIALETAHRDVFELAVDRLAAAGTGGMTFELAQLIGGLGAHVSDPALRTAWRRILAERIGNPLLLMELALGSDRETALVALGRIPFPALSKGLRRELTRLLEGASDDLQVAALDRLLPALSDVAAVLASGAMKPFQRALGVLLSRRLEAAERGADWAPIRAALAGCTDLNLAHTLLACLPGTQLDFTLMKALVWDGRGAPRSGARERLEPLLEKMRAGGWELREDRVEGACPSCGDGPAPGHHEHDGVWYACGTCSGTGKVPAARLQATLADRSFVITVVV